MPPRPPVSAGELEELLRLFETGMRPAGIRAAMEQAAKEKGWPVRHRTTYERHRLAWQIETGIAEAVDGVEPKARYKSAGGTDKGLDEMRVLLQARQAGPARMRRDRNTLWYASHLRRLNSLAGKLRDCLHNPHLELLPYSGPSPPLVLKDKDWSLQPDAWLGLVTPDLSDDAFWAPMFPFLRTHLGDCPFWGHLTGLQSAVQDLLKMYEEAARLLRTHDEGFGVFWDDFRAKKVWSEVPSRTMANPAFPTDESPLCGLALTNRTLESFDHLGYDVYRRLHDLAKRLQELNDDLLPDHVERLITEGRCALCE